VTIIVQKRDGSERIFLSRLLNKIWPLSRFCKKFSA